MKKGINNANKAITKRTEDVINELLYKLSNCNENRKRLCNEVLYLSNQTEELASSLVKTNLRVGELESENQILRQKLDENKDGPSMERLRERLQNEMKFKLEAFSRYEKSSEQLQALTSANIALQSQLNANDSFKNNRFRNDHDLKTIRIDELKRTLENLKWGFESRESQLQRELSIYKTALSSFKDSQTRTRLTMRKLAEEICDELDSYDAAKSAPVDDDEDAEEIILPFVQYFVETCSHISQIIPHERWKSLSTNVEELNCDSVNNLKELCDLIKSGIENLNEKYTTTNASECQSQNQCSELKKKLALTESNIVALREKVNRLEAESGKLTDQVTLLQDQLTIAETMAVRVQGELESKENEWNSTLNEVSLGYDEKIDELNKTISQMKEDHLFEIHELQIKFNTDHESDKELLQSSLNERISLLVDEHEKETESLRNNFNEKIRSLEYQCHQYETEKLSLERKLEEASLKLKMSDESQEAAHNENINLKSQIDELRNQLIQNDNSHKLRCEELDGLIKQLQDEVIQKGKELNTQIHELQDLCDKKSQEIDMLNNEHQENIGNLEDSYKNILEDQLQEHESAIQQLKDELNSKNMLLLAQSDDSKEGLKQLEECYTKISSLQSQLQDKHHEYSNAEERCSCLQCEKSKLIELLENSNEEVEQRRQEIEDLKILLIKAEESSIDHSLQNNGLQEALDKSKAEISSLESNYTHSLEGNNLLKQQVDSLIVDIANLKQELSDAQMIIGTNRETELKLQESIDFLKQSHVDGLKELENERLVERQKYEENGAKYEAIIENLKQNVHDMEVEIEKLNKRQVENISTDDTNSSEQSASSSQLAELTSLVTEMNQVLKGNKAEIGKLNEQLRDALNERDNALQEGEIQKSLINKLNAEVTRKSSQLEHVTKCIENKVSKMIEFQKKLVDLESFCESLEKEHAFDVEVDVKEISQFNISSGKSSAESSKKTERGPLWWTMEDGDDEKTASFACLEKGESFYSTSSLSKWVSSTTKEDEVNYIFGYDEGDQGDYWDDVCQVISGILENLQSYQQSSKTDTISDYAISEVVNAIQSVQTDQLAKYDDFTTVVSSMINAYEDRIQFAISTIEQIKCTGFNERKNNNETQTVELVSLVNEMKSIIQRNEAELHDKKLTVTRLEEVNSSNEKKIIQLEEYIRSLPPPTKMNETSQALSTLQHKYDILSSDKSRLERELESMNKVVEDNFNVLRQSSESNNALNSQLAKMKSKLEEVVNALDMTNNEIIRLKVENQELEGSLYTCRHELDVANDDNLEITRSLNILREEYEKMNDELSEAKTVVNNLNQEKSNLEAELSSVREKLAETLQVYEATNRKQQAMQHTINTVMEQSKWLDSTIEHCKLQIVNLMEENDALQQSLSTSREENDATHAELYDVRVELNNLLEKHEHDLLVLNEAKIDLETNLNQLMMETSQDKLSINSLHEEVEMLQSMITTSEEKVKKFGELLTIEQSQKVDLQHQINRLQQEVREEINRTQVSLSHQNEENVARVQELESELSIMESQLLDSNRLHASQEEQITRLVDEINQIKYEYTENKSEVEASLRRIFKHHVTLPNSEELESLESLIHVYSENYSQLATNAMIALEKFGHLLNLEIDIHEDDISLVTLLKVLNDCYEQCKEILHEVDFKRNKGLVRGELMSLYERNESNKDVIRNSSSSTDLTSMEVTENATVTTKDECVECDHLSETLLKIHETKQQYERIIGNLNHDREQLANQITYLQSDYESKLQNMNNVMKLYNEAKAELELLRSQKGQQPSSDQQSSVELQLQRELQSNEAKFMKLEQEYNRIKIALELSVDEYAELESKLTASQQYAEHQEVEISRLKEENEASRMEADMLVKRLDEVEFSRNELKKELSVSVKKIEELNALIIEIRSQSADIEIDLNDKVRELQKKLKAIAKNEGQQNEEMKSENDKLTKKCEEYFQAIQVLQNRCRDLEGGITQLIQNAQYCNETIERLENEKAKLLSGQHSGGGGGDVREMEVQLKRTMDERDKLRSQIENMTQQQSQSVVGKQQYEAALSKIEELEHERNGYKDALTNALLNSTSQQDAASSNSNNNSSGGFASLLMGNGSNKQMVEEMHMLKKQVQELKPLEKLRPQILELQSQLVAQGAAAESDKQKLLQEIETFADHNKQLATAVVEYKRNLDSVKAQLGNAESIIQELHQKMKYAEEEENNLKTLLEDAKREIEYLRSTSADPVVVDQQRARIEELSGEAKHWERKAQSLSKLMQRYMNSEQDTVQLKEENIRLASRVEELEAEKEAFRSAMQQTMESATPAKQTRQPNGAAAGLVNVANALLKKTPKKT